MRTIQFLTRLWVRHTGNQTRLNDDVLLVIDYGVKLLSGKTKKIADLVGERTEIPDMRNGDNQFNVSTTLAAHLSFGYLNTTTVTDDTFIADTLILTAGALVVLRRTKNLLTEQTITLRLVRTVVDGLWLRDLAIRVFLDLLRRSKTDGNLREICLYLCIFFESHFSNFSIFKH